MADCVTLFLKQSKSHRILNLVEKGKTIDDDKEIAKIFNEYFVNIVQKLGKVIEKRNVKFIELDLDEVNMTITKYNWEFKDYKCLLYLY